MNGRMLQRVQLCVRISARSRSASHATKSQFFTFPRGNPREAKSKRNSPIKAKLEAFYRGTYDTSVLWLKAPYGAYDEEEPRWNVKCSF
jgi:hypothetical protein